MLLLALWPWRHRVLLLALASGFALTLWRAEWRLADRWPVARQGEDISVSGRVASLPEFTHDLRGDAHGRKSDSGDSTWRFSFAPDDANVPSRIRVSWYRTDQVVRGGDCWRYTLRLKTPHGSANPGGFDYEGWLFEQGVGATATVRAATPCDQANGYWVLKARQSLIDHLQQWLGDDPARPLIAALIVGDGAALSDSDWDAFRLTGTSHLVAISGFNLAIVAGFAFWLLRWSWSLLPRLCLLLPAQKAATIGAALLATIYALLAGFEPPVLRALVMIWIVLAALFAGRMTAPSRVLALAWGVIVLADPFAVLTPGLWLSFGAVAAIFYLGAGRLAPEASWRQAVRIQFVLSLALAPLTLFFFHGTPWIAPFVNLVAVPVFALLTPLLLIAVIAAWWLPVVGVPFLALLAKALALVRLSLLALAETHADGWFALSPPPLALLLALFGVLLLAAPRGLPLKVLGLLCLLPLFVPPNHAPSRGFELTALDVGQGLAVVIRTAHHSLLFDAGPAYEEGFDAGESVVAPYLLREGISRLDTMMISHSDLDHRGGAPAVRRLLKPREERGAMAGTPCAAGQNWDWDGVHFTVLNGPADAVNDRSPDNNGGCVLRVETGDHAVLLPADIERDAEARLLARAPELLRADVLLAPHHGSHSSSTEDFVAAVNPDLVIFPAGFRNQFRHPREDVVQRYQALGSELHMTGQEGALSLAVDPVTGVSAVRGWRSEAGRYWWSAVLPVPGAD